MVSFGFASAPVELQYVAANDPLIGISDFGGSTLMIDDLLHFRRAISDANAARLYTAGCGARIRFSVTAAVAGVIVVGLQYTGEIARTDVYNDIGVLLVDSVVDRTFVCAQPKIPAQLPPVLEHRLSVAVASGTHLVEIILPYSASMALGYIEHTANETITAPSARVAKRGVFFGDSITQGYNVSEVRTSWPYLVSVAEASQVVNLGLGGRQCNSNDGTTAGALGGDYAVYLIGYNDFYPQTPLATFKASHKLVQTNFRTASIAAGKPNAKLIVITPTWTNTFGSNPITIEQYRQAIRDAVSEVADANVILVEGATGSMPTGLGNFPDGVHPNDAGAATMATVISAAIP